MRGSRLTLIGSVLGVVGLAMLLVEGIRAAQGHAILSSTAQLLMWLGFAIMAVGGLLLIVAEWSVPPPDEA